MRRKLVILGTSSILALVAAPGQAQTAPQQGAQSNTAGSTPASAQDAVTTDVQAAPATPAAADDGDIVVTGLRQSLRSAQAIKRNSDQQIDSIVASDIGKLPDVALSDVAARIPGVQVDRGGGEASRVLIRGLPDFATTYNGREIFTAESRAVALQDFPAGAIAAIEVFKTTTADLVEGGLAGEVNVRSRKPFDFDGLEIAGSFWGQYQKRSKDFTPNGNLLVSNRWDTGAGEFGALLNFSYTSLNYLDSTLSNTDFIANPTIQPSNTVARFPDIQRITFGEGKRSRPSLNGALQWRPQPGLEFYAEALWQGFRNQVSDRETSVPLYGASAYNDVVYGQNSNLVSSLTAVNPNRPEGFQGATYGKTDTYQYAIGGKYDSGAFHLSTDIARTASKFTNSVYSFDTAYASPTTVTADTGLISGTPSFTLAGVDPLAASNYIFRGFYDRQQIARGRDWQGRIDASYDTGNDYLTKIEAGFRYVDRNAHYEDGDRYAYVEGQRLPLSAVPVDYAVGSSGFPSDAGNGLGRYYSPTYDGIRNNVEQLRAFVGFPTGAPPINPAATYTSNERSYAGYGQLKYAFGTGVRVDGSIGVRVVGTTLNLMATSLSGTTATPIDATTKYTDWLPNANARIRFTDQLQLRLTATQTRSRPGFGQYNPAVNSGSVPGCEFDPVTNALLPASLNPNAASCIRSGSAGNANLKPLKSNNYDASLEYYFSKTGTFALAAFRRDLTGFISNYQIAGVDENGYTLNISQPFNSGKGRIQGAEAQFTTFLDFDGLPDWARAFGIDTNITYLDAKTGVPTSLGGSIAQTPIIGVSKWTYNIAGIYESAGFSTRLSWNHRSSYLGTLQFRGADAYSERVRGIGRLDLSASYDVIKNFTLTADWTNILAKPFRSDLTYDYADGSSATLPRVVRYEESVWSAGFRFRF
ncbi:TonB-dependent receptor [Sphingomonas sp. PB2P19]|uniref:TonB-dependent receptor n=1 Tax=Sphingomonas rhamnosi TaxID=3096156 RepID=UPI002FCB382A